MAKSIRFPCNPDYKQLNLQGRLDRLPLFCMTKLHFPLLIAVSLLAGACSKTGIATDEVRELSVSPEITQLTKAALSGNTLGTDNTYVVYLSASSAEMGNYFSDQLYSYCGTAPNGKWRASSEPNVADPILWPLGGQQLDFLGLACMPQAHVDLQDQIKWDTTLPANSVKIVDWDLKEHPYDVMYAAQNAQGYTTNNGIVDMEFRHSQALVTFSAKCNEADAFTIKGITVKGLDHVGTLTVDNTRSTLTASWAKTEGSTPADMDVTGLGDEGIVLSDTEYTFCGDGIIIMPQSAKSITITYTLRGAVEDFAATYTFDIPRTVWKAGNRYNYALDLSLEEITVTPTVSDWNTTITDVYSGNGEGNLKPI